MPTIEERFKFNRAKNSETWDEQHEGRFALARRVADNRVIAGVHFDLDCEAGFLVAQEIDKWFGTSLTRGCKGEREKTAEAFPGFGNCGELLDSAAAKFPQWA